MDIDTKKVQETNKQVMVLQSNAQSMALRTPEDVAEATSLLDTIKTARRTVLERKEAITRPIMSALARVRDLFKPMELALENAEKTLKAKMVQFHTLEEERLAKEKAKILARAEKGTLRTDTAVKKIEEVGEGTPMKTRTVDKLDIFDEPLLPREFLTPDRVAITKALKAGVVVAGACFRKEKIVTV